MLPGITKGVIKDRRLFFQWSGGEYCWWHQFVCSDGKQADARVMNHPSPEGRPLFFKILVSTLVVLLSHTQQKYNSFSAYPGKRLKCLNTTHFATPVNSIQNVYFLDPSASFFLYVWTNYIFVLLRLWLHGNKESSITSEKAARGRKSQGGKKRF